MAVALFLAAGLGLFVIYPLVQIFSVAFQPGLFSNPAHFFEEHKNYFKPLVNSLVLGASVACLSTVMGFGFAYFTTLAQIPFKRLFNVMATIPVIAPPFVIALAAIMLFGQNGVITQNILVPLFGPNSIPSIYGFWGLMLVETVAYFTTSYLIMVGVFSQIDPVLEEAARNQGASSWRVFKDIILPLSVPGILSSMLIIFIESLADFGNPLILSGNYKVLSVEAYLKITGEYDTAGGAMLALFLLIPSVVAFYIQKYFVEKKSFVTMTGKPSHSPRRLPSKWVRGFGTVTCSLMATFVFIFYASVIFGSFVKTWGADHSFTLKHYSGAFFESLKALQDSLILSAIATPITGLLGVVLAFMIVRKRFFLKRFLEASSMLTFAIPGTVVGLAYILAFNDGWLQLTGTGLIIILLLIFRNAPVGIESASTAIRQIDVSIEEASANLGAAPHQTLTKITLPLIRSAFFSGLAYSFVKSMTAVSAIVFVVSGSWNLVTLNILGFVENSALSRACALSLILVVIVSAVLFGMQYLISRGDGLRRGV